MKKLVSTGLSLAMAMSTFNVPTFATPPIDTKEKCMHLDDMIKDGYWTNKGNEIVCDCRTCKVILADYDHLDEIVSLENAHILSNEVLNKINLFIDRERWKNNNYIQISYDLNGGIM